MKEVIKYEDESIVLKFLYETIIGRILLLFITRATFSKLVTWLLDCRISVIFIKPFIKKNNIDTSLYEDRKYKSFNDYFTRNKKEINIDEDRKAFISPCDCKLSVYKASDRTFRIKHVDYSLDSLLKNSELAKEYKDDYVVICRLTPDNYHRYCYIDSGYQEKNNKIKGILHTVQPIALKRYNFYKTNTREWTILHTNNFNEVVHIEIGAMTIGKIKNEHENYIFKKGEEKGYFEFGGSTIVLLVKKGIITIDEDILENSKNNIETYVKYGEKIGKKNT